MSQEGSSEAYTPLNLFEGEYHESGSKFFAYLKSCTNLEAFSQFQEEVHSQHKKARHHCWAYRFYQSGNQPCTEHSSDDGEPSGSAGQPILGQLKSKSLANAAIIVVRYFGGVKLGVSGLIRAYKAASVDAIEKADLEKIVLYQQCTISSDYSQLGWVENLIQTENFEVLGREQLESCTWLLNVAVNKLPSLRQSISGNYKTSIRIDGEE